MDDLRKIPNGHLKKSIFILYTLTRVLINKFSPDLNAKEKLTIPRFVIKKERICNTVYMITIFSWVFRPINLLVAVAFVGLRDAGFFRSTAFLVTQQQRRDFVLVIMTTSDVH